MIEIFAITIYTVYIAPMRLIALNEFVFVTLKDNKEFHDTVKYGSLELAVDTTAYQYGELAGRENTVSKILSVGNKVPKGILRVGDIAHIHYNSVDSNSKYGLKDEEGNEIYIIPFWDIMCLERKRGSETHIVPVPWRTVCEHIYADNVKEIDVDGKTRKVIVSATGMVVDLDPKPDNQYATVIYSANEEWSSGDIIAFSEYADFPNKNAAVQGRSYIYIRKEDILAKTGSVRKL